ncbi:MAG: class I SAM-dependent methyltransferase [Pseudomonadota bacterium]
MAKQDTAEQNRRKSYDDPDKEKYYDQWAQTYDIDLQSEGYCGPDQAADMFSSLVPTDHRVMDFGCGTGLVGELLHGRGYRQLYGVDVSRGMLQQAERRACYVSVRRHDLTSAMHDDVRYQAGICVGVCGFGPVLAEHIALMIAVLVPAAPLIITINDVAWEEKDWSQQLEDAQAEFDFSIDYVKSIPYLVDKDIGAKLLIIKNSKLESIETCQPEHVDEPLT